MSARGNNKKESLFKEIKHSLQEKVFGDVIEKNWSSKTGWRQFLQREDRVVDSKVKEGIDKTKEIANNYKFKKETTSRKVLNLRKETRISRRRIESVLNNKRGLEIPMERLFTAFCGRKDLHMYNQFNILSGVVDTPQPAKSIDLVIARNNVIQEMIELKAWDNRSDHPLSAALELIIDYFVCKRLLNEGLKKKGSKTKVKLSDTIKLTVLAPQEYFDQHADRERVRFIEKAIKGRMKDEGKVKFSFQVLDGDFKQEDLRDMIVKIQKIKNGFSNRKTLGS